MKTTIKPLAGLAVLGLAFAGLAGGARAAPPAEDPVVASFQRMLDHAPTPTAQIDLAALQRKDGTDPLAKAVNLALWEQDPPQYHLAPQASVGQPARH